MKRRMEDKKEDGGYPPYLEDEPNPVRNKWTEGDEHIGLLRSLSPSLAPTFISCPP